MPGCGGRSVNLADVAIAVGAILATVLLAILLVGWIKARLRTTRA
jgi:lipoprotein signal peptidase